MLRGILGGGKSSTPPSQPETPKKTEKMTAAYKMPTTHAAFVADVSKDLNEIQALKDSSKFYSIKAQESAAKAAEAQKGVEACDARLAKIEAARAIALQKKAEIQARKAQQG